MERGLSIGVCRRRRRRRRRSIRPILLPTEPIPLIALSLSLSLFFYSPQLSVWFERVLLGFYWAFDWVLLGVVVVVVVVVVFVVVFVVVVGSDRVLGAISLVVWVY